jgi:hypothetical protein
MKKIIALIIFGCIHFGLKAQQQLFNEGWQFHNGDITNGEKNNADSVKWGSVSIPHDWSMKDLSAKSGPVPPVFYPGVLVGIKKLLPSQKNCNRKNSLSILTGFIKTVQFG